MFGECHAHIFMDGRNYRKAVELHKNEPVEADIRGKLEEYRAAQISFLRDGGDDLGVSRLTKQLAQEYAIDYRTPVFAIHQNGHYGKIVGKGFEDLKEYYDLVKEAARQGADFIKVMFSGIMDFSKEGHLTEAPVEKEMIREMIHIAHEEGFAVMAHVNGADAIRNAAEAGVDSVEHGNFPDDESLQAMQENDTIWVPTYVTITNLIGSGRFDDAALQRLKMRQGRMIRKGYDLGVRIALGSDAGAYMVPHAKGIQDEYREIRGLMRDVAENELQIQLAETENEVRHRFIRK